MRANRIAAHLAGDEPGQQLQHEGPDLGCHAQRDDDRAHELQRQRGVVLHHTDRLADDQLREGVGGVQRQVHRCGEGLQGHGVALGVEVVQAHEELGGREHRLHCGCGWETTVVVGE